MKPIVTSLLHSKVSSKAAGQTSARSQTLTAVPNTNISVKPLSLRELPNWILALAFIVCAASGFERPWIAEAPLSQDFQLLQNPVVQPQILMNLGFQWPAWMTPSSLKKVVQMPRLSLQTSPQLELDSQTCDVVRLNASPRTKASGSVTNC